MKSNVLREKQLLQRALSKNSWTNYRKLIGRLCQDHPYQAWSDRVSGLLRNNDISGLVDVADSLVLQKYSTAREHFLANQIAAIIKKYPFPSELNPFDPEKKARESFDSAEQKCKVMNQYFSHDFDYRDFHLAEPFRRMRSFMNYVLGYQVPLREIYDESDFGPGASLGVHGNATNLARKLASDWTVTPSAFHYARSAVLSNWQLVELLNESNPRGLVCFDKELLNKSFESRVRFAAHNKIAFVPKTVKTFRSIAVEPLLNGFIQKGVDNVMRKRLRRIGIDLSDQAINSNMSRLGSISDSESDYVTLDLSSASDSISIELCRNLLPPEWFEFLNSIRSKSYLMEGSVKEYHKFCSMGNGFCFPLETLLFAAACISVGAGSAPKDFHVYGDDIIIRKRYAEPLISLLGSMGFSVNNEKTFIEGPFRESCGTDWYCGVDVRPFILDFALDSVENIFKFLNLSRRNHFSEVFFEGVRDFVLSLIPVKFHFFRPVEGPSDTGITVPRDQFMSSPYARWNKDQQCWSWKELINRPVSDKDWVRLRSSAYAHMYGALRGSRSKMPFTVRRKSRTAIRTVSHGTTCLANSIETSFQKVDGRTLSFD